MHRCTASLLAFLGALFLPPGDGRADPRETKAPARADGAAPKEEGEASAKREADAPPKTEEPLKRANEKPAKPEEPLKKGTAKEASSKKSMEGDGKVKKAAESEASSKKPASPLAAKSAVGGRSPPAWTRGQPGVVKLVRGSETLEVRVLDRKQRLVPATLPQFARFLRAKSGADHPIDARLVTLVATVSDHFGGREVNVVSGFRPYSPGQYSRHSNHNEGRAIDFSIKGIANETVRDFCRTFRNAGVGYYPNSLFVHLDVRDGNAYWVDYAAPGQAPRYRPGELRNDEEDEGDAIASVDGGPSSPVRSTDSPREDVARGRSKGRGGDSDSTGERGVFVNR